MKGNAKLINALNGLLADELTAINQYTAHTQMAGNWGYAGFKKYIEERLADETKHRDLIAGRILFLEGTPIVDVLNKITIGSDVPQGLSNDLDSELLAVQHYNEAIALAAGVGDDATRRVLEENLKDEDDHINDIESRLTQIGHIGTGIWLSTQIED